MPEILAAVPDPTCSHLFSGAGIEESQSLAPDWFSPRAGARSREDHARDGRGRFAEGHSGNSKGRPPGIPNPQQRVLTLRAWRANPWAASALLDRRPHLLRPLAALVLPPPRADDPAK